MRFHRSDIPPMFTVTGRRVFKTVSEQVVYPISQCILSRPDFSLSNSFNLPNSIFFNLSWFIYVFGSLAQCYEETWSVSWRSGAPWDTSSPREAGQWTFFFCRHGVIGGQVEADDLPNVGKTRNTHPSGNGLYHLFISIYGDFGDGLFLFYSHYTYWTCAYHCHEGFLGAQAIGSETERVHEESRRPGEVSCRLERPRSRFLGKLWMSTSVIFI